MASMQTIDTMHGDMVHDAQFDYYGRRLATCSSDRLIKVYDVAGEETTQSAELSGCVMWRGKPPGCVRVCDPAVAAHLHLWWWQRG